MQTPEKRFTKVELSATRMHRLSREILTSAARDIHTAHSELVEFAGLWITAQLRPKAVDSLVHANVFLQRFKFRKSSAVVMK